MITTYGSINRYIEEWLADLELTHATYKDKYIAALVRCTDQYAIIPTPTIPFLREKRRYILTGIGVLLARFLQPVLSTEDDGLQMPSSTWIENRAELDLFEAGRLIYILKIAGMERDGLVRSEEVGPDHYSIRKIIADTERFERADEEWVVNASRLKNNTLRHELDKKIQDRLNNIKILDYIDVRSSGLVIRKFDSELFGLIKEHASLTWAEYNESRSFPDHAIIASRTFGEWREICLTAATNLTMHLTYAARARFEQVRGAEHLKKNLTQFVNDNYASGLFQAGPDDTRGFNTEDVHNAFFIDFDDARRLYDEGEVSLPYGIRWKNGLIIPIFGYIQNMSFALLNYLRSKHNDDWQAMVDLREEALQIELGKLFEGSKHKIGKWNLDIKTILGPTDTDGAIYEPGSNCLYIFQLKSPDVWAGNLSQRRSRLRNLASANKWIRKLCSWVDQTPKTQIASALGLDNGVLDIDTMEIRLFVLCEFDTRISTAEDIFDRDASWVSWPRLQRLILECKVPERALEHAYNECAKLDDVQHVLSGKCSVFEFKKLRVDLHE